MKTIRVPLTFLPGNTGFLKNAYIEEIKDINNQSSINPTYTRYVNKRGGLSDVTSATIYDMSSMSPTTGANTYVSGVYTWEFNTTGNKAYLYGYDDKLYKLSDALSLTSPVDLNSATRFSSNASNWLDFAELTSRYLMINVGETPTGTIAYPGPSYFNEKNNGYLYYSDASAGTPFTVSAVTDADCPNGNLCAGVAVLNGYVFVGNEDDNKIYHSDLNAPNTWNANNVISVLQRPRDQLRFLTTHLNFVVAMCDNHIEFFEDVGNTSGSVLKLVKDLTIDVGVSNCRTVQKYGNKLIWQGKGKEDTQKIYILDGLQLKIVSTPQVEADLGIFAYSFLLSEMYVLTSSSSSYSLVYDIREERWYRWTIYDGTNEVAFGKYFRDSSFGLVGPNYLNTSTYNTFIEKVIGYSTTNYNDSAVGASAKIKFEIQTYPIDFGSNSNKFIRRVSVVGNTPSTTSNLTFRYSDDTGLTWTTADTVDLATKNYVTNHGRTKRRVYELTSEANSELKLESLEFAVDGGSYGL